MRKQIDRVTKAVLSPAIAGGIVLVGLPLALVGFLYSRSKTKLKLPQPQPHTVLGNLPDEVKNLHRRLDYYQDYFENMDVATL